jgi:hypothetical protein
MNYTGLSKSNYVEVEDREAIESLTDEWTKGDGAYFLTYWDDGQFAIGCDAGTMYVERDPEEFFSRLGEAIAEPLVIRNVGYEGVRYQPDAWQWVVYPDGSWEIDELTEPDTEEDTVEIRESDYEQFMSILDGVLDSIYSNGYEEQVRRLDDIRSAWEVDDGG